MIRNRRLLFLCASISLIVAVLLAVLGWRTSMSGSITIEWSTSSELDTAGFNLYRSKEGINQESLVNDRLIPASLDPLLGGEYTYHDDAVEPSSEYIYFLEEVEFDGTTTRYGPIEAKAHNSSWVAYTLSGFFLILCGFCIWALWREYKLHEETDD